MPAYTQLEILPYSQRFAITRQLAALMKLLHDTDQLATNEEMYEVLIQYGRAGAAQKRIVDMSVYRLRKILSHFGININRIKSFGAFIPEEDKKRISHAIAELRVQSA